MGESKQHEALVNQLIAFVSSVVGDENHCFICTDASDEYDTPPSMSEGFRPDVYYEYDGLLIIGEAKTSHDIGRDHSKSQYISYLKKCSLFRGESMIVFAVPWIDHAEMHNLIHRLGREIPGKYTITIIDGVGEAI